MSGCNIRPEFRTNEESKFYEVTSKRELYEIARSYARLIIGDDDYIENNPTAIFQHLAGEKRALRQNRII